MAIPDVRVRRHAITYRVCAGAGGGAVLRAPGDALLPELDAAIASLGLHGYWVIRRLEVHCEVAATASASQASRSLACSVAHEVVRVVRLGVDPDRALWFPDRAAFLGRFLLDLAEGRAGDRWEYAQFGDLRYDPCTGPARLAADEPEPVADALLRLSQPEVEAVAASVDVDTLLRALSPTDVHNPSLVIAAVAALSRAGRVAGARGLALTLAVSAARDSDVPVGAVARTAQEVADLLSHCFGQPTAAFLGAVQAGDWLTVSKISDSDDAYLPMVRWTPQERTELVHAVMAAPVHADAQHRRHTAYGGGLLLLPLVDDLWPEAEAAFRLLCLTAALGRGTRVGPEVDPLLRLATGVPDDLDVLAWLEALPEGALEPFEPEGCPSSECVVLAVPESPGSRTVSRCARSLLFALGRRLPGMASASATYLVRNVLDIDAWVTFGGDEVLVELGHPPLGVLLSISGLDQDSFVGGDERRWMLCQRR